MDSLTPHTTSSGLVAARRRFARIGADGRPAPRPGYVTHFLSSLRGDWDTDRFDGERRVEAARNALARGRPRETA